MRFAAVKKHVAVPERAGLVTKERRGQKQLVRTDPDTGRGRPSPCPRGHQDHVWQPRPPIYATRANGKNQSKVGNTN